MNTQAQSQSGIFPRFFMDAKQSRPLSEEAGHPVFVDREMVEIRIAGDNKSVVIRKVADEHKQRWPQHYEAFKKGQEAPEDGLPMKHCPLFSVAQVKTMAGLNIHTVESLAELNDAFIVKLGMGGRGMVAMAKAYLSDAKDSASATKHAAERERMQAEIDMLKQQIAALGVSNEEGQVLQFERPAEKPEETQEEVAQSVDDLKLSSRTKTALKKNDITPDKLFEMTPDQISKVPGLGMGAIAEITGLF